MKKSDSEVIKVHPSDNVIVALQDTAKGETMMYNRMGYTIIYDIGKA